MMITIISPCVESVVSKKEFVRFIAVVIAIDKYILVFNPEEQLSSILNTTTRKIGKRSRPAYPRFVMASAINPLFALDSLSK